MTWGSPQDWLGALLLGGLVLLITWLTGPPRPRQRSLPDQADRLGRTRRRIGARRRWWPLALLLVSVAAHAADDGPWPNGGGGSGGGPDLHAAYVALHSAAPPVWDTAAPTSLRLGADPPDPWALPALGLLVLLLPALLVSGAGYARLRWYGETWTIRGYRVGRSPTYRADWIVAGTSYETSSWHRWLLGAAWAAWRRR